MKNKYQKMLDFFAKICDNACILKLTDTPKEAHMPNYTTKMVARLNELSPITRTVADDLAAEWGLPVRSVISKAVMLGLYKKAEPKAKASENARDLMAKLQSARSRASHLRQRSAKAWLAYSMFAIFHSCKLRPPESDSNPFAKRAHD